MTKKVVLATQHNTTQHVWPQNFQVKQTVASKVLICFWLGRCAYYLGMIFTSLYIKCIIGVKILLSNQKIEIFQLWLHSKCTRMLITRLRAASFIFLVRWAKRARHANDHARDWRRETGETRCRPRFARLAALPLPRACTAFTKSEKKERLFAV